MSRQKFEDIELYLARKKEDRRETEAYTPANKHYKPVSKRLIKKAFGSCMRKKRFAESHARKIATKIAGRCYPCNLCGGWHVTRMEIKP